MIDVGEDILPIVNDNSQIIGDLRLSEVLIKVIETGHIETGSTGT